MLNSIGMKNYKCFKKDTALQAAPLTVLCGTNSSGKSSMLQSVLMLKQTAASRLQNPAIILSGDYVDCGTFANVISDGIGDEFVINNSFKIHDHEFERIRGFVRRQDTKAFNALRHIYCYVGDEVKYFQLELHLTVKKSNENEMNNFIHLYKIIISAFDKNDIEMHQCHGYILFENNSNNSKHKLSWSNIPSFLVDHDGCDDYECNCMFNGLEITDVFADNMLNGIKNVVPNILWISRIVATQYDGINYMSPLRNNLVRAFSTTDNITPVSINGQDTPAILAKLKNRQTMTEMFCPYTNTDCLKDGYLIAEYHQILQQWLDYFDIGRLNVQEKNGVINISLGNRNVHDVGLGANQLLSIITQGIIMDKEQTLMIEQPETYLYPKAELQMADFLIQMAKSNRNVIVETHSDHIINRLVCRVMEDYSLNDLIKIYFMENKNGESIIHEPIKIDKYKGTENLYNDFFTQYTSETEKIIDTGLRNLLENTQSYKQM